MDKQLIYNGVRAAIEDIKTWEKNQKESRVFLEYLQSKCEHVWDYDGHDSHYTYKKCKFCLKEVR